MSIKRNLIHLSLCALLPFSAGALHAQFTFTTNDEQITITGYTGTGGAVTIPSATNGYPVVGIGQDAFLNAEVASVTIPDSVTSIGYGAFGMCSSLATVIIPNSVTNIAAYAFFRCASLVSVTIPNGVTVLRDEVFGLCYGLATVTIPGSVTNIQIGAFEDCTSLSALYFLGNAPTPAINSFIGVSGVTVYYLAGTSGWGATFAGFPTKMFGAPLQISGAGVQADQFGFTFAGTSNQVLVIEACTNLVNANWEPIQTNTPTGSQSNFSDSQWRSYTSRFYRLRSQ
jgi:hypothetical protein